MQSTSVSRKTPAQPTWKGSPDVLRIVSAGSFKEGSGNSRNNELAHSDGQKLRATRWRSHCCNSQSAGVLMHRIGLERSDEQLAGQQEPRAVARIGDPAQRGRPPIGLRGGRSANWIRDYRRAAHCWDTARSLGLEARPPGDLWVRQLGNVSATHEPGNRGALARWKSRRASRQR